MGLLILGIGNVLLRDEGIGVRTLLEIESRYDLPEDVELLDGGTAGIELLRHLENRDHLIIIDAIRAGHPPGTVFRIEGDDVPKQFMARITPHQIGLSDVLAAGILSDSLPERMVLFGVEPKEMDAGLEISGEVLGGLDKLTDAVCEEAVAMGYALTPLAERRKVESMFW